MAVRAQEVQTNMTLHRINKSTGAHQATEVQLGQKINLQRLSTQDRKAIMIFLNVRGDERAL